MDDPNDKCVCGGYRKHHPSDRNGGGCKRFRLWKEADKMEPDQ